MWQCLTRALLGGGVWTPPPPSGFSRIAKKRRRAAPPGFRPPYPPSFPQLLWKFWPKAMWGQVTRSGQVTQLQNNFPIAPRLQCFRESYETFGILWGHQCLQNVYLGFLISVTSGQVIFATSPLTRAHPGGGWFPPPPSGFLQITQKRRRAAPPRLV